MINLIVITCGMTCGFVMTTAIFMASHSLFRIANAMEKILEHIDNFVKNEGEE